VRRLVAIVGLWATSCFSPDYTHCSRDGVDQICPSTMTCVADAGCVTPNQLASCAGLTDGVACTYDVGPGFCHAGACVTTLERCGDGVASLALGEVCDCGTAAYLATPAAGCSMFNADVPGATCRSDCSPARCGDAIVDPNEACDDGNHVSGDGCAADCSSEFVLLDGATTASLSAAWMMAPDDFYAIGDQAFVHYVAGQWTQLPAPPVIYVAGIWASSPTDIWTVGVGTGASHFDGAQWSPLLPTVGATAVWGGASDDVYAVGLSGTNGALIAHYDGTTWTPAALPVSCNAGNLNDIRGWDDKRILSGYGGVCVETTTTTWTQLDTVSAVAVAGYAGRAAALTSDGRLVIYDLVAKTTAPHVVPGPLARIVMTSADEVLGISGAGVVLRYSISNDRWTHPRLPVDGGLNAAVASSPTNVFIVGDFSGALH